MTAWDFSCRDWEQKIIRGEAPVPALRFFPPAELATAFFDQMRLPDVIGSPLLKDAAGDWFRWMVAAIFGSVDPVTSVRLIREIMALVPKGSSKTTYGAALMLTALLMNRTPRAEFILVGPTQAVADRALSQAIGMIDLDRAMKRRFKIREHTKEIIDQDPDTARARLVVKTFDLNIMTGTGAAGVLLDEIHLLGTHHAAGRVMRQLRGGLEKTGGFLVMITTQSDIPPAGVFKEELIAAREIRDGRREGRMLPILYEFPRAIASDPSRWKDPLNWPMVMPNLGRPMRIDSLVHDWEAERIKGEHAEKVWASQHLNIEIGVGIATQAWSGASRWESATDPSLTFETLLRRSEVICAGIDGGGADDLYAIALLGREIGTRRWLLWVRVWALRSVLELRKTEAPRLLDFEKDGDLIFVDELEEAYAQSADLIAEINETGLLARVGLDAWGVSLVVDELARRDIEGGDRVVSVAQGWQLNGAIKTAEVKLLSGSLVHAAQPIMAWAVGNAKVELKGNAITITKQVAGTAKIDPLMATFDAVALMSRNPEAPGGSIYEDGEAYAEAFGHSPAAGGDADPGHEIWSPEVLAAIDHPDFPEHKRRFEAWQDHQPEEAW